MKVLKLLLLFLLIVPVSFGQVKPTIQARINTYIRHHKAVLVSDGIVFAAWEADVGSTIHCQEVSKGCFEQNPILGRHPSEHKVILYGTGMAALSISSLHLIDYLVKDDPYTVKVLRWFPTAAFAGVELFNVKNNVDTAEYLQNLQKSRARVMR